MYLVNAFLFGIICFSFFAVPALAGEPCNLRLALRVDADAGVPHDMAYAVLARMLCEIRDDIALRGAQGLGRQADGILQYLDGRRRLNIVVRKQVFAEAHGWRIFPFGPKRILVGPAFFTDEEATMRLRRKDGSEVLAAFNVRKNIKRYLLHELTHIAGFFLSREKTAYRVSGYYYPDQTTYKEVSAPR